MQSRHKKFYTVSLLRLQDWQQAAAASPDAVFCAGARRATRDGRRVRVLTLTQTGEELLVDAIPCMASVQELILAPLTPGRRKEFMHLLNQLMTANQELSRAHSETGKPA